MTEAIDRPTRLTRLRRSLEELRQSETHTLLALSLAIGALVGLVTVAFILLTGRLSAHLYPAGGAGWRRILVPTLGGLGTGYLIWKFFPSARGSGIPQAKAALFLEDGRITLRTVLGKFFCCSASLATGIALGREGPSVHVGAGLASVIARKLGLSREQVKALVPVGCSAALAAAFNTPIAAVLFTLEEVMGDLHASVLGTAVLASATSWMVLHFLLGDDPLFHVPAYRLVDPAELICYIALGLVGGLASVAFVKLLLWLRKTFALLPRWSVWCQPAVGGLVVGIMGYFMPDVMGVGYDYIDKALNGDVVLKIVVLLAILKIVATAVCYGSGNAGGIFAPTLFIGATIGAAVGGVAHHFFPNSTAGPGAYALVGMGTAFAGIVRTPMTSVIMIFELTRDYTIIVPLMISNMIAYAISYWLQREPIYEALAHQDGIHLPTMGSRRVTGGGVGDAMHPAPVPLTPDTEASSALTAMQGGNLELWPVADSDGLRGMIRRSDLERETNAGGGAKKLTELIRSERFPHVHPDHNLSIALERMGSSGQTVLPVVSRANVRKLMGVITLDDVLGAYGVSRAAK
jgi:CIC family chloride channel protein